MSKPIPSEVRRQIVRLSKTGQDNPAIAREVGYSVGGVAKILRLHRQTGEAAFLNKYPNCGKSRLSGFSAPITEEVMRREAQSPGAPFVYSVLRSENRDKAVPHYRTIQRWWKKAGNRKNGQSAAKRPREPWTKEPHHTWQIDGKEQIGIATEERVSWMNVADEATSTALQTTVFSPQEHE